MAETENILKLEFAGEVLKFSLPTGEGDSIRNSVWKEVLCREKFAALDLVSRHDSGLLIDLGAGLGQHTIAFASATSASVFAFEFSREFETLLRTNIDLNSLTSRIIVNQTGQGTVYNSADHGYTTDFESSYDESNKPPQNNEFPSLDSMKFTLPVAALRVNSPGTEIEVLDNAKNTIRQFSPSIYLVCKRAEIEPLIKSKLVALGYSEVTRFEQCSTVLFQPRVQVKPESTAEASDNDVVRPINELIENLERDLVILLDQRKNVQERKGSMDMGEPERSPALVYQEDGLTPEELRSRISDLSFDILRTTDLIASLKAVVQRSVDRISSMLNDQADLLDNILHRDDNGVTKTFRNLDFRKEYERVTEELLTTNKKLENECKRSKKLQTEVDRATSCLYLLESKMWENSLSEEKVFAEFQNFLFLSVEEILHGYSSGIELTTHSKNTLQHSSAGPASGVLETLADEKRAIEEKNDEMSRRITELKRIVLRKDRELDDYRNSSSFMIGKYIVSVSRNPFKLLLFPGLVYRILNEWVRRKTKIRN